MDGREFLRSGQDLPALPCERNWRSTAGRAYSGLLHEGEAALRRWGFPKPPAEQLHQFVRRRFNFTPHPDLRRIGRVLDDLSHIRNQADYPLSAPGQFRTGAVATQSLADAAMVAILDGVEADPARRAAVVAALRAAWP